MPSNPLATVPAAAPAMSPEPTAGGLVLKALREHVGMSQSKLAKRAENPATTGKSAIIGETTECASGAANTLARDRTRWRCPAMSNLTIPILTAKERVEFMRRIDRQPNGCWLWTGTVDSRGYGSFFLRGRNFRATRVSMALAGFDPGSLYACHHCDTPLCVNPDHLFPGTQVDNMADCVAKGRKERGSAAANAKLTEAQVLEIRRRYATYERLTDLAEAYGVSPRTVSDIVRGLTWAHVEGPVGRPPRSGMHNPMGKLTETQRQEIVDRYFAGSVTQQQLADEYGVCFQRISQLVRAARGGAA